MKISFVRSLIERANAYIEKSGIACQRGWKLRNDVPIYF